MARNSAFGFGHCLLRGCRLVCPYAVSGTMAAGFQLYHQESLLLPTEADIDAIRPPPTPGIEAAP